MVYVGSSDELVRRGCYCCGISPHGGSARGPAVVVAGHYCVVAHAGVALRSASPVDSGLLFAISFGRMVSAGRYSQRSHGVFDGFVVEPCFLQSLDAVGFSLYGRYRYPVIGSNVVVGVGVVAHEFDHVEGEGRRVAVLSGPAGKESGPFAVKPPGADAAPLQQQLLHIGVVVELEHDRPFGVVHGVVTFATCSRVRAKILLRECPHRNSASTVRVDNMRPMKRMSSFSKSENMRRNPFMPRTNRSVSLRLLYISRSYSQGSAPLFRGGTTGGNPKSNASRRVPLPWYARSMSRKDPRLCGPRPVNISRPSGALWD